jgi:hypothetical protein
LKGYGFLLTLRHQGNAYAVNRMAEIDCFRPISPESFAENGASACGRFRTLAGEKLK